MLLLGVSCITLTSCGHDHPATPASTGATGTANAARPLTVTRIPTPRLNVPLYDTSGSIPQVASRVDLRKVNVALRAVVTRDQRAYAPSARRSAKETGASCRGIYGVATDRRLLSASTVVVSALLPLRRFYPCGGEGEGWLSVTVEVPSGRAVTLSELFRDAEGEGVYALGVAWFRALAAAKDWRLQCVVRDLVRYQPTLRNYRYFALTPRGLALGFWQEPACGRLEATVPYSALRPYLSDLGRRLVAGVRGAR